MLNGGIEVKSENLAFDSWDWFSTKVKANLWQSTNWEIPDVSHIIASLCSSLEGPDAEKWPSSWPHMLSIFSRMGQGVELARQYNKLQAWHLENIHLPEAPRMGWCYLDCAAVTVQQLLAQEMLGQCGNGQLQRRRWACRQAEEWFVLFAQMWALHKMKPFSGGVRLFSFTPGLSKPGPQVIEAVVTEAVATAGCSLPEPPYCTVTGEETCWYGEALGQLTNFYQSINVFIYSLLQKKPWLLFGKIEQR